VVLDGAAGPTLQRARELGLLLVSAGPDIIRLLPPLNVSEDELDEGVALLDRALTS
jgi:4-aminobutyrate aminotransferase-like enzyme